mmetsp:Transcript_5544/g.34323  ORF Transcript_5544/g.34323 Transcript_5544/m.34323 type:complete len:93 (+) Transcript_5544:364-642(+)
MDVPAKVEEQLRSRMKARALRRCDDAVRRYVECTKHRTLSVIWACRNPLNDMNACLHQHTTEQELQKLKTWWVEQGRPGFLHLDADTRIEKE